MDNIPNKIFQITKSCNGKHHFTAASTDGSNKAPSE